MKIDEDAPSRVEENKHVEIPMRDGVRLAARTWMPYDAADSPVPAILEYIPYRKNDKTLERDWARAPYIAARGYAYVRVDLRGSGESEGVMLDEYTAQELEDGCDVISWLASREWCDGKVGLVVTSSGVFNALQIAALQPPALKAVVSICSTDDRYADDVHYMGGTLLIDQLSWASVMFGINTLPPDPVHVGDRWRRIWLERLEGSGLWLKNWLEHQTRDEFWKHGSVCEDYSRINVPVYALSGWADGYCRAVFRLLENLNVPRKGLVGPWSHRYPHVGIPGPAIDWLGEALRWWDHWLKGSDTGIMDEPSLRVFMQDHAEPRGYYEERAGRWVEAPGWPTPIVERIGFSLGSDGRLAQDDSLPSDVVIVSSPLWVGIGAGKWCSYAHPGDQPIDQRRDDSGSVVFQTDPLEVAVEILGDARLTLRFTVDRPVAMVAARLVDVAPDGAATRVSYGVLNLTHRESHEKPEALVPDRKYTAEINFKHVAQIFRAGHRIRLSLSTSYFPICWPSPEPVRLTLFPGDCEFTLPLFRASDLEAPAYDPPRIAPPLDAPFDLSPHYTWNVVEDRSTGRMRIEIVEHEGEAIVPDNDLWISGVGREVYEFDPEDVASVVACLSWTHELRRNAWRVRTVTETTVSASGAAFHVEAGKKQVHAKTWCETIPRQLV